MIRQQVLGETQFSAAVVDDCLIEFSRKSKSSTKRAVMYLVAVIILGILPSLSGAQTEPALAPTLVSRPRITQPIDDTDRVRIPNTKPLVLRNAIDQGRMYPGSKLEHLILVLKSSPEQEHALGVLLNLQQDKTSQTYHRWLTPDEFGVQFGVAPADLQKIADWLGQKGLT